MVDYLTKVIIDTSIYIPFINSGIAHPVLNLEYKPLFYMSAVVVEELYAGAFDNKSIKCLDRMYETFEDIGRIVVPEASDWQKTGKVITKLGQKYVFEEKFLLKITNDVLIALSARRIGAVVVTSNVKNFLRIKEFIDFKMYGEI
ncbi:MAG: type II toxin-antitoxin system VapC family toxin [Nitrospirae bacterium]|nr:type II toxin-antitoxin system VapC family toxin [Nitrospirota bacterium]